MREGSTAFLTAPVRKAVDKSKGTGKIFRAESPRLAGALDFVTIDLKIYI